MPDIEGLKADPQFKALPPDRQQALLSHLSAPNYGPQFQGGINQVYQQDIAKPLTDVTAGAIADVGQRVAHPQEALRALSDPMQYMQEATTPHVPPHELPPFARSIAEYLVPQTATSAALTGAAFALPRPGLSKILGDEMAGPATKILGSRLGRTAAGTAIGAGVGAATGEDAGKGAMQGLETFGPAEAIGGVTGWLGRHFGEGQVIRDTTAKFGKSISRLLPWAGKIEKGSDFADAFMGGNQSKAVLGTAANLNSVKQTISQRMKGHIFNLPKATPDGIKVEPMTFQQADQHITELQQGYGFNPSGTERAGPSPREARHLSYHIRDQLADELNTLQKGLGDSYLKSRRKFDAAKTLTDMFDKRDLIGPQGLNQPKLIDRVQEYSEDLERALGHGTSKNLLDVLRRGFVGEGKDIPGHAGKGHFSWGLFGPHYRRVGGKAFDPIGQVPGYMRPSMAPVEAAVSNAIGKSDAEPVQSGPAGEALDKSRAQHLAPTPSAAKRAEQIGKDLEKGKKPPDVHKDLNRGRLSMDETNKLVQYASATDPSVTVQGMPLSELLDALEQANPEERQMLLPLVKQRLMAELPKQQNKTLVSNLSQRFMRLQQTPPQTEASV